MGEKTLNDLFACLIIGRASLRIRQPPEKIGISLSLNMKPRNQEVLFIETQDDATRRKVPWSGKTRSGHWRRAQRQLAMPWHFLYDG